MTLQELEKQTGISAKVIQELGLKVKKDYPQTIHLWNYDRKQLSDGSWALDFLVVSRDGDFLIPLSKYYTWCKTENIFPEFLTLPFSIAVDGENDIYWYDRVRENGLVEVF